MDFERLDSFWRLEQDLPSVGGQGWGEIHSSQNEEGNGAMFVTDDALASFLRGELAPVDWLRSELQKGFGGDGGLPRKNASLVFPFQGESSMLQRLGR
eukprot:2048321-Rhodomonas_salina.1